MESYYKKSYAYMMCDGQNRVLYIGVTTNLPRRIRHHRNRAFLGFTDRYKGSKLIYYESYESVAEALARVYLLKGLPDRMKYSLVEAFNPDWEDLSANWVSNVDANR